MHAELLDHFEWGIVNPTKQAVTHMFKLRLTRNSQSLDQDWQNHQQIHLFPRIFWGKKKIHVQTVPSSKSSKAQRTFEKASCGQRLGNLMGGTGDFDDEFPKMSWWWFKNLARKTSWVLLITTCNHPTRSLLLTWQVQVDCWSTKHCLVSHISSLWYQCQVSQVCLMCVHTLRARPIFRGDLFFFRECQLEGIISSKGRTRPKPMLFFLLNFQIRREIATGFDIDRGLLYPDSSLLRRRIRSKHVITSSLIFLILHSQQIIICILSKRVSF